MTEDSSRRPNPCWKTAGLEPKITRFIAGLKITNLLQKKLFQGWGGGHFIVSNDRNIRGIFNTS